MTSVYTLSRVVGMSNLSTEVGQDMTVSVSYCRICDIGRVALEIPDEPCGHSNVNKATFLLPVAPIDPAIRIPDDQRS